MGNCEKILEIDDHQNRQTVSNHPNNILKNRKQNASFEDIPEYKSNTPQIIIHYNNRW